ncbi:MAG: competence/damage-inducible protein A [Oscillospiraceae bacterium]
MVHSAELIAVGTELLLGSITNLDAQMISEALSSLGVNVYWHTVVGDNPDRLRQALEIARKRADLIITTGGLGPTYDDLTKQTVCETFGKELRLHEDILETIRDVFTNQLHKDMPENNLQQAMFPDGCAIFPNPVGTAPGCAFESGGVRVLMLPGPPYECRHMLEHYAVPYLRGLSEEVIVSHDLRIFGIGESHVEQMLHEQMVRLTNPTLAPYAKLGECMVRVTAKAKTEAEAEEMLRPVIAEVKGVLGDAVYGQDVASLEEVVSALLRERGLTLAAAESCTGGLLAKRMTDLAGASRVFRGGVVSYTNEVKAAALGVPQETLDVYGAVSAETAKAMAEGVRALCGSDLAVSITGVAGPDKDDRGNEVGTVFIGLAAEDGTMVKRLQLGGWRERIRTAAANCALDLLRRRLMGLGEL